jgi:hypothetical protein
LALGYQRELHALVARLRAAPPASVSDSLAAAVAAADARYDDLAVDGLRPIDLLPTLQWATALRVLRDLSSQGWTFYSDDEGILLNSPGTQQALGADPERGKEALRRSFAFAREAASTIRPRRASCGRWSAGGSTVCWLTAPISPSGCGPAAAAPSSRNWN